MYYHVSTGFFPPAVLSTTRFISVLAAMMLETGIAINRGPTGTLKISKQDHTVDKHVGASYIGRSRNRFQVDFHRQNFRKLPKKHKVHESFLLRNKPTTWYVGLIQVKPSQENDWGSHAEVLNAPHIPHPSGQLWPLTRVYWTTGNHLMMYSATHEQLASQVCMCE